MIVSPLYRKHFTSSSSVVQSLLLSMSRQSFPVLTINSQSQACRELSSWQLSSVMLPMHSLGLRWPDEGSYVSHQPGEASREGQSLSPGTEQLAVISRFTRICQSNSTPATSRQSYDEVLSTENLRVSWCGSQVPV